MQRSEPVRPRRPAPVATASAPRVSTAGSGSTRTRWPESGHHPTTRPGTAPLRAAQGLDEGHEGELGAHRAAARPGQHDQVGPLRAHVGPAPQGEEGRVGAVPPAVAADDGCRGEGGPVERAPQPGRPGHRLGSDGRPGRPGEPGEPAVELGGARAAVAYPARGLVQPGLPRPRRGSGRGRPTSRRTAASAEAAPRRAGGPGEGLGRTDRRRHSGAQGGPRGR